MSFSPLTPLTPSAGKRVSSTAVLRGTARGRWRPKLTLSIRPAGTPAEAWLTIGARCDVMLGGGEHAGQLLIQPRTGGDFEVLRLGKPSSAARSLFLPWPRGATPQKRGEPVEILAITAERILVALPRWATPSAAPVAATPPAAAFPPPLPPPAPPPPATAGRISIMDRVPDPAAADRLRQAASPVRVVG